MRYHILVSTAAAPQKIHLKSGKSLGQLRGSHREHKETLKRDVLHLAGLTPEKFKKMKFPAQARLLSKLQDYPLPFYFFDQCAMRELAKRLKKHDSLVLHGDGSVFSIGLSEPSVFDLSPVKLAERLNDYDFPKDLEFQIELLACNLGSSWHGINFAQILSQGLKHLYQFEQVKVHAYAGYIVENRTGGKYFVALDIDLKKGQHAALEDARVTYLSGCLVTKAKKSANLNKFEMNSMLDEIKQIREEQRMIIWSYLQQVVHDYLLSKANPKTIAEFRYFMFMMQALARGGISSIDAQINAQIQRYYAKDDVLAYLDKPMKSLCLSDFPQVYQSLGFEAWRAETIEESLMQHRFFARLALREERRLAFHQFML